MNRAWGVLAAGVLVAGGCATRGTGAGNPEQGPRSVAAHARAGAEDRDAIVALPPEIAARVHESERIGLALYLLDHASAIATDVGELPPP